MNGQSVRQVLLRPSATYAKPKSVQSFGRAALAAIVAVMLAQTLFLVWGCDWDLCGDEAEYWAWSRKLDWSYFSRGPAVAWMIRLGTELLGWLSLKLTGSLMFAVRFPCVVLGGITGWGVYRLAGLTIKSAAHQPHRRVAASCHSRSCARWCDRDERHSTRVLLGLGGRLVLSGDPTR